MDVEKGDFNLLIAAQFVWYLHTRVSKYYLWWILLDKGTQISFFDQTEFEKWDESGSNEPCA
jgi:hypothetical protein